MADPLDTVAFLAGSENRVRLLEAVVDEPRTRAELHEETDIARATLGRVLSDLEARNWIRREGKRYEATPAGAHLAREFGSTLNAVGAIEELGPLLRWLPGEEFDFDLGRLRDARLTHPTATDSVAPVQRAATILQEADSVFGLTTVFAHEAVRANHEAVTERDQQFEVVLHGDVVDRIRADEEAARLFRELLADGGAAIYRYDGDLPHPYNVWIIDDRAVIGVSDDEGAPRALLETPDTAVRDWVRSTVESYRQDATPLSSDGPPV